MSAKSERPHPVFELIDQPFVKTSSFYGDLAVSKAVGFFSSRGFEILFPSSSNGVYDFVIEKQGKMYRVQSKYCACIRRGSYYLRLKKRIPGSSGDRYDKDDFDLLWVVCGDNLMLVPISEIINSEGQVKTGIKLDDYKEFELSVK